VSPLNSFFPAGGGAINGCGKSINKEESEPHMQNQQEIILSDNEIHMLNALAERANETAMPVENLIEGRRLTYSQGLSAIGYLCAKGLAESVEIGTEHTWALRKFGHEYEAIGLPEKRLWEHLVSTGSLTLQQVNEFLPSSEAKFTIGMYLGTFQKAGLITFSNGRITPLQQALPASIDNLQRYLTYVKETSERDPQNTSEEEANKRKLVEDKPTIILGYRLTKLGKQHASLYTEAHMQLMVNNITHEMLLSGEWRNKQFRPLGVVAPPEIRLELQHPLPRFLTYLRRSLVAAGFNEVTSPILETQFWNLNAIFMQKYHPVRGSKHLLSIEDITLPADSDEIEAHTRTFQERFSREYLGQGISGSRGWGSSDGFSNDKVVIRSHSTPVTVRQLAFAEQFPVNLFGFSRCCRARPEKPEFLQMDVLVADEGLNVTTLMGTIKHVCLAIFPQAVDIQVQSAYFPFAEISVNIWVVYADGTIHEVGSSGLMRPESAATLGIQSQVALIGFNVSTLARILSNNASAINPNNIGFEAFNETEIPLHAQR
jgi:phenylalanyl-tRNA synthetase alpha chain